jgi:glycine dehydrogenase
LLIDQVGISLDETVTPQDVDDILNIFGSNETFKSLTDRIDFDSSSLNISNDKELKRTSEFLKHKIFNTHHSEAKMVRYLKMLENKDVSLVHSMVICSEASFLGC